MEFVHVEQRTECLRGERKGLGTMVSSIDSNLQMFFKPQVEQLCMRETPMEYGASFMLDSDIGTGGVWVAEATSGCLVTVLNVQTKQRIPLLSHHHDYACIGRMSQANTKSCPIKMPAHLQSENLVTFNQEGGSYAYDLDSNERYSSCSVVFTPDFFDALKRSMPFEADLIYKTLSTPSVNALPFDVWSVLNALTPQRAAQPGARLFFSAKINELLACVVKMATEEDRAKSLQGSGESQQLAHEAYAFIKLHYREPLTLDVIARALFVSRTRLAAVFKQETGVTLGGALRAVRINAACEALESTELPVQEIARSVGYARHSSFAEAFKAQTGCSPSTWREEMHAGNQTDTTRCRPSTPLWSSGILAGNQTWKEQRWKNRE